VPAGFEFFYTRLGGNTEGRTLAAQKILIGDAGNHCAVVSAKLGRWKYAVYFIAGGKPRP
jgi:hypothetical protein